MSVLHPICTGCHWQLSFAPPDPERLRVIKLEICCACQRPTRSGIYVEAAVEALPCVGHGHKAEVRT